jgi:hypothetical protein
MEYLLFVFLFTNFCSYAPNYYVIFTLSVLCLLCVVWVATSVVDDRSLMVILTVYFSVSNCVCVCVILCIFVCLNVVCLNIFVPLFVSTFVCLIVSLNLCFIVYLILCDKFCVSNVVYLITCLNFSKFKCLIVCVQI